VTTKDELTSKLRSLKTSAELYFTKVCEFATGLRIEVPIRGEQIYTRPPTDYDVRRNLPAHLGNVATDLRKRVGALGVDFISGVRPSPLLTEADLMEIRIAFRTLAAALKLCSYRYHEAYAISEEDRVYGMAPPDQSEETISADSAKETFATTADELIDRVELLLPSEENLTRAIVASEAPEVRSYRPNTAFIMMQISNDIPKLEDVKNSFKDVFKSFGITALRSDEIEHQDVITQRILDEIATSEFLIADLTGARPSVYYEVGYAHALKRRPILYREKGTPLHFDLMVHNVPEYENITDLKNKLTVRLLALTGREPGK